MLRLKSTHRLLCGDSTDKADVEKLMDGEKADMVFTDPPYGIDLDTDYDSRYKQKGNKYRKIENDNKGFDPRFILNQAFPKTKEVFLWGAHNYAHLLPPGSKHTYVCWDKSNEGQDRARTIDFELCWSKNRHKQAIVRKLWKGYTAKEKGELRVHPTQKPVEVCEWFFERWGKGLTNVVDLFGGSGSTLIACEKTNRKCFMSEIDPHYCSVIIERWQNFTGKKAQTL